MVEIDMGNMSECGVNKKIRMNMEMWRKKNKIS